MPITVNWETEEKRVVLAVFDGEWNWNDFHAAARQMHDLVASVDYRVGLLLWHKTNQPIGNPLVHFQNVMRSQPSNTGKVVVVNNTLNPGVLSFMRSLGGIIAKIFPTKSNVTIVRSLEEAHTILAELEQA